MCNEFKDVPEEVCLDLLKQAHSTGGSIPPALHARLLELSQEDSEYVGPYECPDAKSA
jgi:hypothetical protein